MDKLIEYNGKIGQLVKYSGCTHTQQRRWTKEEEQFLLVNSKIYNLSDIALALNRTYVSIHLKHKRLNKKPISNNMPSIVEKYKYNDIFMSDLQPKSILDVFAGTNSFYSKYQDIMLISNDRYKDGNTYQMDSLDLLMKLNIEKKKFDLIDLDPFGSAFDCIELALRIAKKGIIITYGECGHRRYKRLDFVQNRYNINTMGDFNINHIISETQKIALRHKKKIIPFKILDSNRLIYRVYYKILPADKTPTFRLVTE